MRLIKYLLFLLILFSFNQLKAEDRENQLNKLFNELKINNATAVYGAEQKIWEIWSTHPTDQLLTSRLAEGSKLVRNKQLVNAVDIFTEVIKKDPTWAEAWNKRATVFYMVGEFQKSQKDIDKVLELEERHFGALAGQGMVNIQLKNYDKAKRSYQKAQEIYPAMKSSKVMIEQIEELIKRQSI